ncbi:hypothetical protein ACLI4U_19100 (plasmid) [Natrialbaceae archaeon A-CW2]
MAESSTTATQHAPTEAEEVYEYVTITEYNDLAGEYGRPAGERAIVAGHRRNTYVRDDEAEGFVQIGEAVAIIELYRPLTDDEINGWCNSSAGKLALAHWFDHVEPDEVIE